MTAAEYLEHAWRRLRDDARPTRVYMAHAATDALHATGALSDEQRELWMRRFESCPGHGDEGGRSWYAYCGEMPKETE